MVYTKDGENSGHNRFLIKWTLWFLGVPILACLLVGIGYTIGNKMAFDSMRAISNDIEHQNEFTKCLIERWKTVPKFRD